MIRRTSVFARISEARALLSRGIDSDRPTRDRQTARRAGDHAARVRKAANDWFELKSLVVSWYSVAASGAPVSCWRQRKTLLDDRMGSCRSQGPAHPKHFSCDDYSIYSGRSRHIEAGLLFDPRAQFLNTPPIRLRYRTLKLPRVHP